MFLSARACVRFGVHQSTTIKFRASRNHRKYSNLSLIGRVGREMRAFGPGFLDYKHTSRMRLITI